MSKLEKLYLTKVWRFVGKIIFQCVGQFCRPLVQIELNSGEQTLKGVRIIELLLL